jgi:glutathione S-transferase
LWQYSFSNYNEKVRWALDYKSIPHVRHSMLPGSPRAMRLSRGDGTVPVLELDGALIRDSTRIIEMLEERWPERSLYPDDPDDRRRALELEDFFDEEAGHELRRAAFFALRYQFRFITKLLAVDQPRIARLLILPMAPIGAVWATRRYRFYPADAREGERKVFAALDRIEAERGNGDYLVGDAFSIADLTAASVLFPIATPPEYQYDYPEPPHVPFWDRVTAHPAVDWIREMFRRHRGVSAELGR